MPKKIKLEDSADSDNSEEEESGEDGKIRL